MTLNYNEVNRDKNDFYDRIHSLIDKYNQIKPKEDQWGSVSA